MTVEPRASFCPHDGEELQDVDVPEPPDPYIGTVIAGDIEIQAQAGAGAMGRVYRGRQRSVDRTVAVKILKHELSANKQVVRRFEREAKIASKVQHPHVVDVHFAGQLPDGSLYMVMEFLDGQSLASVLRETGPLPVDRTLTIAMQICDAVGGGHANGVVHRDLKPDNIMLISRAGISDWVKVLDFGIAKLVLGESASDSAAGLVFGTPRYISPEGARGAPVGPQGDVYAIATVVYEMLSGATPFTCEDALGLILKHISDEPPSLHVASRGRVPEPIARLVMQNLAKEPSQRAPDGRALALALSTAASEARVAFLHVDAGPRLSQTERAATVDASRALDPTVNAVAMPALTNAGVGATLAMIPETPPRRRAWTILAAALALAAVLSSALLELRHHSLQDEREAYTARARRALAEGKYVSPPGVSVRDLVSEGLRRWPDDDALIHLRSDAAHELMSQAMIARSSGDLGSARDFARVALEIDPADLSAKALAAQYDHTVLEAGPATSPSMPPRSR